MEVTNQDLNKVRFDLLQAKIMLQARRGMIPLEEAWGRIDKLEKELLNK